MLKSLMRIMKKKPDSFDRDTLCTYKNEAAGLIQYHSLEDIGRAFLEETRKLDYSSCEDVERSYFVHRVSFNCFLNLQKRATSQLKTN